MIFWKSAYKNKHQDMLNTGYGIYITRVIVNRTPHASHAYTYSLWYFSFFTTHKILPNITMQILMSSIIFFQTKNTFVPPSYLYNMYHIFYPPFQKIHNHDLITMYIFPRQITCDEILTTLYARHVQITRGIPSGYIYLDSTGKINTGAKKQVD